LILAKPIRRKTVARAFIPATERERSSVVEAMSLKRTVFQGKANLEPPLTFT
jgi:hypothetical protein